MLSRRHVALLVATAALLLTAGASAAWAQAPPYRFAPYVDMAEWPPPDLATARTHGGITHPSLGFVTAEEPEKGGGPAGPPLCSPTWGGYPAYPASGASPYLLADVQSLRAAGGDVVGSFGGQAGAELATVCTTVTALKNAYRAVVDAYNLTHLDFDIEGAIVANAGHNARRASAISQLQQELAAAGRPITVSFTVAVEPNGLTDEVVTMLEDTVEGGVSIALVNLMTMDFAPGQVPEPGTKMAQYAEMAALNARTDLSTVFPGLTPTQRMAKIGVTPLIGIQDEGFPGQVFTRRNAVALTSWAFENRLPMMGMWSVARDVQCTAGVDSRHCSGIFQPPWAFAHALGTFDGPGVPPQPAEDGAGVSAPSTVRADFNGDSYSDLAIGAPGENDSAGVVHVLYGSANGLTATGAQYWSQNTSGIVDSQEIGDRFGSALATGDLNGDGRADLAIGAPGESGEAGVVHVIYGSLSGLTATGAGYFSQDSSGITGTATRDDHFGAALAVGNFGGSPAADLAIGAPGESTQSLKSVGSVHVLPGAAPSGVSATGAKYWTQDSGSIPDATEAGDRFGAALAAGDLGRSAHDDLAVGAPGEDAGAGMVHAIFGTDTGLTGTGSQFRRWPQAAGGSARAGDHFGAALAIGPVDQAATADLVIGVPDRSGATLPSYGAVFVASGSATGLTSTFSAWNQNTAGIADSAEAGDRFGASVAVGDVGHGGQMDVAIGAPGENAGAGVVHVLYGSASGANATSQLWSQDSGSIAGAAAANDHFGASVAIAQFDGSASKGELVVTAPEEDTSTKPDIGAVHVLPGTSTGLTATGSQYWTQDSGGIVDSAEVGDRFGGGVGR